jgi:hypothetical protein
VGEHSEHAAHVDTWIARLPKHLTPEQMVSAFEQGFSALWRRTSRTLGDVTVSAIVERGLHDVSANIPLLTALKVENGVGVQFAGLRRNIRPENVDQLREGMRSTFIHLLTIIGNLTGDILTPALHVELSNARVEDLTTTRGRERPLEGR